MAALTPDGSSTQAQSANRLGGLAVVALCLGQALGASAETTQPIWVAAILKNGWLSKSQVGWLASGELFFVAMGALSVSVFGGRTAPRRLLVTGTSLALIFNAIAMLSTPRALVIGRLFSGAGMGVLLATVLRVAAHTSRSHRLLSAMQLTVLVLAITLFLASPALVGRYGPAGLFAVIVALAVVGLVSAAIGLPDSSPPSVTAGAPAIALQVAPLLSCLGIACASSSFTTVWTYIVAIGSGLGFGPRSIATSVGSAEPAVLLAPIVAMIAGERAGLFAPVAFSLATAGVAAFFLVSAPSSFLFAVYAAVYLFGATLWVPYALAALGRCDPSGTVVSAAPVAFLIGSAVGPTVGAWLLSSSFYSMAAAGAVLAIGGVALFGASALMSNRPRASCAVLGPGVTRHIG